MYEEGVPGGLPLYFGKLESTSSWHVSMQSRAVRYPLVGEYPLTIGYVKIVNNLDSPYSTATVRESGVGSKFMVVEYYAPAFKGYDYSVYISAAP